MPRAVYTSGKASTAAGPFPPPFMDALPPFTDALPPFMDKLPPFMDKLPPFVRTPPPLPSHARAH
eukprot:97436-Rhodomonas_salina.1